LFALLCRNQNKAHCWFSEGLLEKGKAVVLHGRKLPPPSQAHRASTGTIIACNDAVTTPKPLYLISHNDSGGKDFVVDFGYHICRLGLYQQQPDEATRTKQKGKLTISEKQR